MGGMRVYSDERFETGQRLDLDVLLPDESVVRCWAEVVWIGAAAQGDRVRFDVGLKFTDIEPADLQRLAQVLVRGRDGSKS